VPAILSRAGTETVDFTQGAIRPQRDVMDEQMRPRPQIAWQQLRSRLEIEFGMKDSDLKQFDEIPDDAVLDACVTSIYNFAPRRSSGHGSRWHGLYAD
jgi:hypothetical protein